jgi:hypothetical protein
MSNYVKSTNFAAKDALASGNAAKIVKGTEIDTEFNNIATAVATKADVNSGSFIGTVNFESIVVVDDITADTIEATTVTADLTGDVVGSIAIGAGTLTTTNWTIIETSGALLFKYGGVSKMKLDSSGNLTVTGTVSAADTI